MTQIDYLTHLNLALLILIEQYCIHPDWKADVQVNILSLLLEYLETDTGIDNESTQNDCCLVDLYERANEIVLENDVYDDGQNEQMALTLGTAMLERFEQLQNLDNFHEFFCNLDVLFHIPNPEEMADEPDIISLDENSLLGFFVRKCNMAFQKCEFYQAAKVYEAFAYLTEAWYHESPDMLAILDNKDADMVYSIRNYVQKQINILENEHRIIDPQEMQTRIHNMIEQQPDHTKLHYLSYLNYAQNGEWELAEKSLRRYFDSHQGQDHLGSGTNGVQSSCGGGGVGGINAEEATEIARDRHDNIALLYLESWIKKLNIDKINKQQTDIDLLESSICNQTEQCHRALCKLSQKAAQEKSPRIQAHAELQIAVLVAESGYEPRLCFEALTKATILCYNFGLDLKASLHTVASSIWRIYGSPILSLLHIQIAKELFGSQIPVSEKPRIHMQEAQAYCDIGDYESAEKALKPLLSSANIDSARPRNLFAFSKFKDTIEDMRNQIVLLQIHEAQASNTNSGILDDDSQLKLEEILLGCRNKKAVKSRILESQALLLLGYTQEALDVALELELHIDKCTPVDRIRILLSLFDIYKVMADNIERQRCIIQAVEQAKENRQYGLWKRAVYKWKDLMEDLGSSEDGEAADANISDVEKLASRNQDYNRIDNADKASLSSLDEGHIGNDHRQVRYEESLLSPFEETPSPNNQHRYYSDDHNNNNLATYEQQRKYLTKSILDPADHDHTVYYDNALPESQQQHRQQQKPHRQLTLKQGVPQRQEDSMPDTNIHHPMVTFNDNLNQEYEYTHHQPSSHKYPPASSSSGNYYGHNDPEYLMPSHVDYYYDGNGDDDDDDAKLETYPHQKILDEIDDSHLDRKFDSQPSMGPSAYQREQFEMDDYSYYNNAPIRQASLSLKKRLSKRLAQTGSISRPNSGKYTEIESIPLHQQNSSGGGNTTNKNDSPFRDHGDSDSGFGFNNKDVDKDNFENTTSTNRDINPDDNSGGGSSKINNMDGEFRTIHINDPVQNMAYKFLHNRVSTAKYNLFTFLPKFLFEQFSKYANLFFLFTACIQQIPNVSPTSRWTTLAPLVVVLCATALKELAEDRKRHQSDKEMNRSMTHVLVDGQFVEKPWREIVVGDILRINNKEAIPADLVILSSSEPEGLCYIETSNLDGETNLKVKQARPETANLLTAQSVAALRGHIKSETPNDSLYTYQGTFVAESGLQSEDSNGKGGLSPIAGRKEFPLDPTQVLLRGAILRNTDWVFTAVVFTGHETKLMRNATAAPIKQTDMEKMTNKQIIFLFIILLSLSIACTVGNKVLQDKNFDELNSYLWLPSNGGAVAFIRNILTFIILYNNLIPISLIVTMEFVKFQQAQLINSDLDMYDDKNDTPALARTSSLVEELGQIEYIFSDKTGTLTRNIMEFRQCSVGGIMYSDIVEAGKRARIVGDQVIGQYDFKALREQLQTGANKELLFEFFQLLATCHTVIPEVKEDDPNSIEYQASSPDEGALVKGAALIDFKFHTRKPRSIMANIMGTDMEYEVLNVNEFNSTRKRMSVVIRCPDGTIKLYCKGADTVILERLDKSYNPYEQTTLTHLEEYATEGLRTLCIAMRNIPPDEYERWNQQYERAATSMKDRQEMLDEAAEQIEKDLFLLGATAIEDKLQDQVPQTIFTLAQAGIKIWVLTGDRQETAINIGYSCKLLHESFSLLICNETTDWETKEYLSKKLEAIRKGGINTNIDLEALALIIDGRSLDFALEKDVEDIFLELACMCKAVICCRVSPLQKALVVKLVKRKKKAILLSIGDGANDVSMIQAAHVGVGISGQEGLQAARSADFAISQFRYLRKLLLVHGAWSYHRLSKMILFSFYKNIALYMTQFWFAIYNGFSGQTVYESWSITFFTVFFTVLPPLAIGIFDQFLSARSLDRYPEMYKMGQQREFFNVRAFWGSTINAFYHSVLLYFISMLISWNGVLPEGLDTGQWVFSVILYTSVLGTVLLKAALITNLWTKWTVIAIPGSYLLWIAFLPVYAVVAPKFKTSTEYQGIVPHVYGNPIFWFTVIMLPIACILRDYAWKFIKRMYRTRTYHVAQEIQKFNIPDYRPRMERFRKAVHKVRLIQRIRRTRGYAFSQNEGGQTKLIRSYDTTRRKPKGN
ncbi:aminophospholipid translocase [Mycoemilia scoparia]|uniref:P-type phospholipid transporter n=1 Tax=Mycoemilia scoparia TaxID=417184 RepID=A0A9W7ZU14_9FUNG|nr:aminophospholipid translocase [Mycoemilia scoparia]